MPWLFAFPLEVSVPGQNKSTEMEQCANVRTAAEALLQEVDCLGKERGKERQLQEANLNKLPLHLFQFTGGNIFLHII